MKITQYLRSIGNLVSKGPLLEDLRLSRSQFNDSVKVLENLDKSLARFKTKEMSTIQSSFQTVVRGSTGKNLFGHIAANIQNINGTIDALEAIVAGEFDDRVAAQGLDYRRGNVLQLIDALVFSARFTIKLATHALKVETAQVRDEKKMPPADSNKVMGFEEDFIREGLAPYLRVIAIITAPSTTNADRISKIPEILATDSNYSSLRNTIGDATLDPFGFGAVGFRYNPFRAYGMAKVEAKIARAREAETELQSAQLRLMQLERARQGKEDPNLEREIRYTQSLIDSLENEIREAAGD